jgi:hypothetical protein
MVAVFDGLESYQGLIEADAPVPPDLRRGRRAESTISQLPEPWTR